VLEIEDEAPIRHFLRTTLSDEGFQTFEAHTGQDGLQQAAARNLEIIVLDLSLPDLDGLEVIRRLRDWMVAPIIILSARNRKQDKVEPLDRGG
jgi:two-component system KDP operon response regulator KdpE